MAKQMYGTYPEDEYEVEGVKKGGNGNTKVIIAVVATGLVFILAFVFIYFKFLKQNAPAEKGQLMIATNAEDSNPLANRSVSFVGMDDCTIKTGDSIKLENLPENQDFYLKFQITDTETGKDVYSTDLIPSGQSVMWVPSENLDKGVHHLAFLQLPYWKNPSGEYIPLTAGNNEVALTIE